MESTLLAMPSVLSGAARASVLSVLEECTDALAVYQRTLKKEQQDLHQQQQQQQQQSTMHTRGLDIDWRIPGPEVSTLRCYDTKDSQAAFQMANEEVIFEKLRQDSLWLEQLMQSARRTLVEEGNLDILINEVKGKMAARSEEEELLAKARDMEEKLKRMRQEVAEEQTRRADEEARLRAELLRLRNEKEKLEIKSHAESAYVKAWLDSRREQQSLRAKISRERLADDLQRCRVREENERLVTKKVEAFLRQSTERSEEGARSWCERRQTETKSCEKEIHRLRSEIEERRSALELLEAEYKERQEFIDTCLAEKEAARRQRELEDHIRGCAIKIQSWWRGVMVRRKLGPYRPEEKKRKRPNKPKK